MSDTFLFALNCLARVKLKYLKVIYAGIVERLQPDFRTVISAVWFHLRLQQTIKDLFEEPSGLESLTKQDTKEESRQPERARDMPVSNGSGSLTAQADTSAADSVLNDDLMEQVLSSC